MDSQFLAARNRDLPVSWYCQLEQVGQPALEMKYCFIRSYNFIFNGYSNMTGVISS
jgi:hypothetical protein